MSSVAVSEISYLTRLKVAPSKKKGERLIFSSSQHLKASFLKRTPRRGDPRLVLNQTAEKGTGRFFYSYLYLAVVFPYD